MFKIPNVPSSDELVDYCFRAGSKEAKKARSTGKEKDVRMRVSEEKRIHTVARRICGDLSIIVTSFPSYEQLTPFYHKFFDIRIDKNRYKKSLGALSWVCVKLTSLEGESIHAIRSGKHNASKHFLGKTSSLLKRVSGDLTYLREVGKIIKSFPLVKELPTLVVAGYPNVGKSTFVRNLTGSKIEVASYPFTTKGILIGYAKLRHEMVQIIDSPGLLDRPLESRNAIELQAVLALKDLADKILFIYDPTMESEPQLNLFDEIAKSFTVDAFVGVNKADAADKKALSQVAGLFPGRRLFVFTANDPEACRKVFEEIFP